MTLSSYGATVEPLKFLMNVFARSIASDRPDLTNRQMALLMTVYLQPLPHTIRGLSANLSLTKPVVSRAIQHLEDLGYVCRRADRADRRSVFVERTPVGAAFLVEFSDVEAATTQIAATASSSYREGIEQLAAS